MPKRAFYPAVLILFALIEMANLMGFLPGALRDFWPVIMIIVGLYGLLTADKEAWMNPVSRVAPKKAARRR